MTGSLLDTRGTRKYLTAAERRAFVEAARKLDPASATFCLTVALTGSRISETLMLTSDRIDEPSGSIIIETLKRRKRGIFRAVPVPRELISMLVVAHGLHGQTSVDCAPRRLWSFSRTTAWKKVKVAMTNAGIPSAVAKPKALRHAFAVEAVQQRIALSLIRKWLGHARIETTAIYADALGEEERALAKLMWRELCL